MRIVEETNGQSLQILAEISKLVDAFAQFSRILEDDSVIGDDNMAAKPVKIDNFRNTFDLPLHTVEIEVPSFKHRRSSIVNSSVVGMKTHPFCYGEPTDKPLVKFNDAQSIGQIVVKTKAGLPYESRTKENNANQYQVMKLTPQRHHDMLIWITRKHITINLSVSQL